MPTCDCVSQFIEKAGVYRIVIAGVPKYVYCSFEGSYTWTVRKTLILKYKDFYKIINFLNYNTDKNITKFLKSGGFSIHTSCVCEKEENFVTVEANKMLLTNFNVFIIMRAFCYIPIYLFPLKFLINKKSKKSFVFKNFTVSERYMYKKTVVD